MIGRSKMSPVLVSFFSEISVGVRRPWLQSARKRPLIVYGIFTRRRWVKYHLAICSINSSIADRLRNWYEHIYGAGNRELRINNN